MDVNERRLFEYARCPLRVWPPTVEAPAKVERTALDTMSWAVLRFFQEERPSLGEVRNHFCSLLSSGFVQGAERRKAVLTGNHFAKQLHDTLYRYDVIQPVTDYCLLIEGLRVCGEYGVLRTRNRKRLYVIRTWKANIDGHSDVISMARWLHCQQQNPGQEVGILHISLTGQENLQRTRLNPSLARQQLGSILKNLKDNRYFPVPGSHCDSCLTKSCMEIYNVS